MKNKEAEKHKIGDWVQIEATVERISKNDSQFAGNPDGDSPDTLKVLERTETKTYALGQIVGAKRVYEGRAEGIVYPDEGGNYLTDLKGHFVWLVRLGLLNKPLMVLPAGNSTATAISGA